MGRFRESGHVSLSPGHAATMLSVACLGLLDQTIGVAIPTGVAAGIVIGSATMPQA
jgi:hypothetical protein